MKSFLLGCGLAAVLLAISATAGISRWHTVLREPGPLAAPRAVVIPRGGTEQLAAALVANDIISSPAAFRASAWLTQADGTLHAAEFAFPAHASIEQVLAILRGAKPVQHRLTIAEGLTARQIQVVLARAEAMTGTVSTIEEGSVLPQTYDYEYGADRAAVVARARNAMDRELAADWAERAPGLPLSSPRDVVILASIVERETAKPEERAHVAAVYLNRLRKGMRLQADPTVVYLASEGAGMLDHPLTKAELRRDDPFNTYRSAGLPPAPICSPSAGSLRAVVRPAQSEDLFFVADGSGGHVFSQDYGSHEAAVSRWRGTPAPHDNGK